MVDFPPELCVVSFQAELPLQGWGSEHWVYLSRRNNQHSHMDRGVGQDAAERNRGPPGRLSGRPFQVSRRADAFCPWSQDSGASETGLLGVSLWGGVE